MNNQKRMQNCLYRAANGEELTIGFFGGSITQGSLASEEKNCYAYRVFTWWQKRFPEAKLHYVNGGIGGTTSHYGVSRAVEHLLMYQPDFVVVDFSVNDEAARKDLFQETYEGLLRKILAWNSRPAVLVLNNVYYDSGITSQDYHNEVADYYGVAHVSIKDTVYKGMLEGNYTRPQLTPDGLHPNDFGHGLVAEEICKYLSAVWTEDPKPGDGQEELLPEPITANRYESAKRLTIANCSPRLLGFRTDTREKLGHLDHFKNGWIGTHAGDKIIFSVTASCIAVQYRKTVRRPAPIANLVLDGDEAHPILLDANFEEDWGECLYLQPVLHHGEEAEHTVEIIILDTVDNFKNDFYLMSLIIA